jgi:hypothetical protein
MNESLRVAVASWLSRIATNSVILDMYMAHGQ